MSTNSENLISFDTPRQPTTGAETERTAEEDSLQVQKRRKIQSKPQSTNAITPRTNVPQIPQDTPPATTPLLRYEIPPPNNRNSPSPPPSPSTDALKRRKLQQAKTRQPNPENQEQRMAVDEEAPNQPPPTGNRTQVNSESNRMIPEEMAANGNAEQTPQESTRVEINEEENTKILACLDAVSENEQSTNQQNRPGPPIDRYTDATMPEIHNDSPAALLEGLDKAQVRSWLNLQTGKVLARPFDTQVKYQPNHETIANNLRTAVNEITGSTEAAVAPPNKTGKPKDGKRSPITFLIHNLTQNEVNTLLGRPVWSAKEITFQVTTVSTKRPEFLFTIESLSTPKEEHVLETLVETWNDHATSAFFMGLVNQEPEQDRAETTNGILNFIKSVKVCRLDIKSEGGKPNTHFNVYARGEYLKSDGMWYEIKVFLKGRVYRTTLYGRGRAKAINFTCGLCHGCDHPRGLCQFPKIRGWNGGGNSSGRREERGETREPTRDNGKTLKHSYASFQADQNRGSTRPRKTL